MRHARYRGRAAALGLLVGAALLAAGVACGGGGNGGETVDVSLKEWTLTPSASTAPAGKVTFAATNDGAVQHELVIIKTDMPVDQLPVTNDTVDVAAAGDEIGEIERFDPGQTEEASFDLEAGTYALICNIPTHYAQGLRASFTVQ